MKEKGKSIAKFFLKHTWFEDLLLALPPRHPDLPHHLLQPLAALPAQ
jgi:hypothetical protein